MPFSVLFLDIDGVLNSEAYARTVHWLRTTKRGHFYNGFEGAIWDFCPVASAIFADMMVRLPEVKVVVSSSWRIGRSVEELRTLFLERGLAGVQVLDRTGQDGKNRGEESQAWLDGNPEVTRFVILDDNSDMAHLKRHLIQTDGRNGLTLSDSDRVVRAFESSRFWRRTIKRPERSKA